MKSSLDAFTVVIEPDLLNSLNIRSIVLPPSYPIDSYLCPNCRLLIDEQRTRNLSNALSCTTSTVSHNHSCPRSALTPSSFLPIPLPTSSLFTLSLIPYCRIYTWSPHSGKAVVSCKLQEDHSLCKGISNPNLV